MIKINKLSKSYGKIEVLKNTSLEFSRGNIYGVVGENGAGKTTLFRCIAGLEQYTGIVESDTQPLKNHLGFLMTDPYFFTKITGQEYLRLLSNARGKLHRDLDALNIFDLPLQRYASTYSTGMKKKLALTGILLQENDFLILDEPFNGLDIQTNISLMELLLKRKEFNKLILISSHIFSTFTDTCDVIHFLKKDMPMQTYEKEGFIVLEEEMKAFTIGNRIKNLVLR